MGHSVLLCAIFSVVVCTVNTVVLFRVYSVALCILESVALFEVCSVAVHIAVLIKCVCSVLLDVALSYVVYIV